VLVGFAGLLLFMGFLTFDSIRQLRVVGSTSAALRQGSHDRDALRGQMLSGFYHSATLVRDYLSEPDDSHAADHRSELKLLQARTETALARYQDTIPQDAKEVQNLREHAASYWKQLAPALDWNRAARHDLAKTFLQETVIPGRNELVQLVRQVNDLDKRDVDAGEKRLQELQSRFSARVTTISVVILLLGAILVVTVLRHTQRLESEMDTRFHDAQEARSDLGRLSERLVTVQEEERRSLSRDLHDGLGQDMAAMLIEIGILESALDGDGTHREHFATVRRMGDDIVAKIRNMSLLLRPSMLDELGLIAALRWQAREVTRRAGLKVKLIADELDNDVPESHRTCVFRVVQEALDNCVKHSKATEALVVIRRETDGLSVFVQDNGVGFDPARDKGVGLLGMAERVSRLGGRFDIEAEPGEGTILAAHLSLDNSRRTGAKTGVV
jgi:signal transduction histidine kinase